MESAGVCTQLDIADFILFAYSIYRGLTDILDRTDGYLTSGDVTLGGG